MIINHIYTGNNVDITKQMDDEYIDMVLTSPPYDDIRDYQGYAWDYKELGHELYRVLRPGGVMVWVVNDTVKNGSETLSSFKQAIYFVEKCGFNLHDTMIYAKKSPMPIPDIHMRYLQAFEYMFVFSKGTPKTFNPLKEKTVLGGKKYVLGRRQKDGSIKIYSHIVSDKKLHSNIFYYDSNSVTNDKIAYKHPAMFPDKLALEMIYTWSNKGDIVYDPFMGSGTTAKACIKLKRNYVGAEISKEYCELANKRIEIYKNQLSLF